MPPFCLHLWETMDCLDCIRRFRRRASEIYSRNRKLFFLLVLVCPVLYYFWSKLLANVNTSRGIWDDKPAHSTLEYNVERRLFELGLRQSADDLSASVQHEPLLPGENAFVPLVGNGLFSSEVRHDSVVHLRSERVLTLPLTFHPVVCVEFELMSETARALDYASGVAHSITCYTDNICVESRHYAHRTLPNLLVQDIRVVNSAGYDAKLYLSREIFDEHSWPRVETGSITIPKTEIGSRNGSQEFETLIGPMTNDLDHFFVNIIAMKIPSHIYVKPRSNYNWQILTAICESERNPKLPEDTTTIKSTLQSQCLKVLKGAMRRKPTELREAHEAAWRQAWATGVSISTSKAKDALNGDKINATMYYVLSNVRSPTQEEASATAHTTAHTTANSRGCYGNLHHTFQATNLWNDLSTFFNVQKAASYWLLTLQKQGCDNLVASGALGVMQAMVLSFGSFRFSSQHLEFNMHPKFLHRDYTFRRLQYGNWSQMNVSVQVQEDNKAVLWVAVEHQDRPFYACDAGCLDGPRLLQAGKLQFPVKLTEPITAILYISPDKRHLDDLRHAIHVHEVVEAPAHEHGVIALHRHGHHLGGLPTFFWVSVCILILIFHLFLFKLIYNEYCTSSANHDRKIYPDKKKIPYSKWFQVSSD